VTRLDLVVGPNGAGKSTFVRLTLAHVVPASAFVNADEIARREWPDDPVGHSYDAAARAAATRRQLIERRRPFIAETVFSHPSKLTLIEEARAAGYYVALHVLMVPEELAIERVHARVAAGGHDVPTEKITARYRRLWDLVADAVDIADAAGFWDNARRDGPALVALFEDGFIVGPASWPDWAPAVLTRRWPSDTTPGDAG
jgi:predicted ABC-type ATPase